MLTSAEQAFVSDSSNVAILNQVAMQRYGVQGAGIGGLSAGQQRDIIDTAMAQSGPPVAPPPPPPPRYGLDPLVLLGIYVVLGGLVYAGFANYRRS